MGHGMEEGVGDLEVWWLSPQKGLSSECIFMAGGEGCCVSGEPVARVSRKS